MKKFLMLSLILISTVSFSTFAQTVNAGFVPNGCAVDKIFTRDNTLDVVTNGVTRYTYKHGTNNYFIKFNGTRWEMTDGAGRVDYYCTTATYPIPPAYDINDPWVATGTAPCPFMVVSGGVAVSPKVTTTSTTSSITATSATLGGNVTSDANGAMTERGIVWGTSTAPTVSDNKASNGTGTGTYSGTVSSLPSATTVYFRAYALSPNATVYGSNTYSFITLPATPGTPTASQVNKTSFVLNWNAVTGASSYKIDLSTSNTFSSYVQQNVTVTSPLTLSSLTPGTTYYFRLRAVGAGGTSDNSVTGTVTTPIATISSVSSAIANGTYKIGTNIAIQVNFSEAVNVTGTPLLTLETGATDQVANYTSGSGSTSLIFTYTVQAGDVSTHLDYRSASALALNGGTIKDAGTNNVLLTLAAPGAVGSLGSSKLIILDAVRPTATITVANTSLSDNESSLVTIAFSEAVAGFSNADLTVENGTLSAISTSNGITFTATLTPSTNITDATNVITLDNTGVTDVAGNTGTGTTTSNNYAIDTTFPTSTIVVADNSLSIGETSLVTITFTEAVTGFSNAGISVPNGTLSTVSSSDGGITWTASFTPTANVTDATNRITYDNTAVEDAAGNPGSGTAISNNFVIDNVRPTATIAVTDGALSAGETTLVTITFSESIASFTNTNLTVANGTLSAVSSSDGIVWTATLTPTANVTDATNLIVLNNTQVTDMVGNAGTGTTNSNNYTIDTARPTATITVADGSLTLGETSLVTITFSEAVTGFANADLTVANGTLSAVSTSNGGITWIATLTPTANTTDATNLIVLTNTGVTDAAGNAGTGTTNSNNYTIDNVRPTATIAITDAALSVGETSLVTINFSEAVTGFSNTDLTVSNGTLSAVSSSNGGITWTATLTPTANITNATNLITLANAGVADAAGNAGTGTTSSNNYTIDTARPTATITVADATLTVGETSLVTITFSEAVTGFTNADLTVANGTLSTVSTSNGGITFTAILTPAANIVDATNTITLNNTGVLDAAGNTGTGTTSSNNYTIDTTPPSATITIADNALSAGETSLVTITFNKAVNGFTASDITVANGTITGLATSDGGTTWAATLTPTANVTDATNLLTIDNTGVTDATGNVGIGTSTSNNYAIDNVLPTATIVVANAVILAGESALVTITFSEAITGFTNADLTVANGTLSSVTSSDGGLTWTATLSPTPNVNGATNVIALDNTGIIDPAGNTGTGTTNSNNYAIYTTPPTATITIADNALSAGETTLVTIIFSEAITGFTNADLTIANGTLSAVASSDGGITWIATLTPSTNVTDASNLVTLDDTGVINASGNAGIGTTSSNNYAIDTARPTSTITVADNSLSVGETSPVTITFSEAVTGFANADLMVPNGTLSTVSSSDGGITWTATLTPTANVTDATNVITIDNTGVADAAGNTGVGTSNSNNYAIDNVLPTSAIVVSDNALSAGETSIVTITFSEAVTGFINADLTVVNGTLSTISSSNGGITWTAILTPSSNVTDATNVITIDNTGVADALGNAGTGTTTSNNYAIDTTRPTATITVADNALSIGETTVVTITFSEAVTGFANADLTVANGILSAVSSSNGGIIWTATLTPSTNVTDATNLITLDNTGITDAIGNTGTGTTNSNNYAIDTTRPTATITVADNALSAGETSLVTITYSEAVTGFTNADLTMVNGTLSAVSSSNGGITWTATLTPTANITDATNLITVDYTGVMDVAGNAGTGTTSSNNYAIDTTRPTATITIADNSLSAGETAGVTITFSEAVTGFTNADLTVVNGILSVVSSSDGGITWAATLTPTANVTDATNVITLANTGIIDAAGNTGTGITSSNNYAIDTKLPTIASVTVPANGTYKTGTNLYFTLNFDETVTVSTSVGTPYLTVTLNTGGPVHADYLSGSGTQALTFRYSIASGDLDNDGISLASTVTANGGTIKDAAGNDALLSLNSVGVTSAVFVDAIVPTLNTISIASNNLTSNLAKPGDQITVTFTASEVIFTPTATIASQTATITNLGSNTYTAKYTMTNSDIEGAVSFSISFTDAAGNIGTTAIATTNASTVTFDKTPPATPTDLIAAAGNVKNVLSWAANAEIDLNEYKVYSGTAVNPTTPLNTVNAAMTTYTHTGLTNGTTYYYRITAIDKAGNESIQSVNAIATPSGDQIITFSPLTKTYGDADFDPAATTSSGLPVSYSSNNTAVATVIAGKLHIVGAGTATITASQVGNSTYNAAPDVQETLTVNKASATFALSNLVQTYNGTPLAATATTNPVGLSGVTITFDGSATAPTAAGSYAVVTSLNHPNYAANNATGTFVIAKATATFTLGGLSHTYDGTAKTATVSTNPTGLSGVTITYNGSVTLPINAGNYAVKASLNHPNYSASDATGTLVVGKANQSINFSSLPTKTYGDANFTLTATASSGLSVQYTSSDPSVASVNGSTVSILKAGTVIISALQVGNSNYNAAATIPQTLTISPATLTITTNNNTKVYGANLPSFGVSYSGFMNNDDASSLTTQPTISTNATATSPIGSYTITANGAVSNNYSMVYMVGNLAITPANITATADVKSKVYGDADPALTYTFSGNLVPGDFFTGSLTRGPGNNVGSYSINQGTLALNSNYTLLYYSANLSISPAPLLITADNKTRIYLQPNPTFTATYSGFKLGDGPGVLVAAPTFGTTATTNSTVGTYVITPSAAVGSNYTISYQNGTLNVTPADRTLTFANMGAKTFGNADFLPGAILSSGETVGYTSSNTAVATIVNGKIHIVGAGTSTITASAPANLNYSTSPSMQQLLTVNKAEQTISFLSIPEQIKGNKYDLSAVSSSAGLPITFATGDASIATVMGNTLNTLAIGNTTITASAEGNANYLPANAVTQQIKIIDQEGADLIVRKAVSPNGDGINDFLYIEGVKDYPENNVVIVNRNGVKIAEIKNYDNSSRVFTGKSTVNGRMQPPATYFYMIEIKVNGKTQRDTGYFMLKYTN
jgi:gliding motility-associated-like protein